MSRTHVPILVPRLLRTKHSGYILSNGLRCVVMQDSSATIAAAAMCIRAGKLNDLPELPGVAHFCEHMLFMGTDKYPQEDAYDRYISTHGGYTNAWTSDMATCFYFRVSAAALPGALERFVEFFVQPLFSPDAVSREVQAVHSEDENNHTVDAFRVAEVWQTLYCPTHPKSRYGSGNATTLWDEPRAKGVNTREGLLRFYARNYSASNACLAIYSARPPEEVLDGVEEALLRMRSLPAGGDGVPDFHFLDATEPLLRGVEAMGTRQAEAESKAEAHSEENEEHRTCVQQGIQGKAAEPCDRDIHEMTDQKDDVVLHECHTGTPHRNCCATDTSSTDDQHTDETRVKQCNVSRYTINTERVTHDDDDDDEEDGVADTVENDHNSPRGCWGGFWLNIQSMRKLQQLQITWLIHSPSTLWRVIPSAYISHILGHECDTSVLALFQQRNWATAMSVGPHRIDADYEALHVHITLTAAGMSHTVEMIDAVYRMIALASSSSSSSAADGVDAAVYAQMKAEEELHFEAFEMSSPEQHCVCVANNALETDVSHCLRGGMVVVQENMAAVRAYMAQMIPERAVVSFHWGDLPLAKADEKKKEEDEEDRNDTPRSNHSTREEINVMEAHNRSISTKGDLVKEDTKARQTMSSITPNTVSATNTTDDTHNEDVDENRNDNNSSSNVNDHTGTRNTKAEHNAEHDAEESARTALADCASSTTAAHALFASLPDFAQVAADTFTRFHRTPHARTNIPAEIMQRWRAARYNTKPYASVRLPASNPFLATELTIYDFHEDSTLTESSSSSAAAAAASDSVVKEGDANAVKATVCPHVSFHISEREEAPVTRFDSAHGVTLLRKDRGHHGTFNAAVRWSALSPVAYASPRARLYTSVMCRIVQHALTEVSYFGELAALSNSIYADAGGLAVSVAGPFDHLHRFFLTLLTAMLSPRVLRGSAAEFDMYREEYIRRLRSCASAQPYTLAMEQLGKLGRCVNYTHADILHELCETSHTESQGSTTTCVRFATHQTTSSAVVNPSDSSHDNNSREHETNERVSDTTAVSGASAPTSPSTRSPPSYAGYLDFVHDYVTRGLRFECFLAGNMPSTAAMHRLFVQGIESCLAEHRIPIAPTHELPRFRDAYALHRTDISALRRTSVRAQRGDALSAHVTCSESAAKPADAPFVHTDGDTQTAPWPIRTLPVLSYAPFHPSSHNIALVLALYAGEECPRTRAMCDTLAKLLSSGFFHALRTRESLGYVVSLSSMRIETAAYLVFTLQSAQQPMTGCYLLSRVLAFIEAVEAAWETCVTQESLQTVTSALIEQRLKRPNSVDEDVAWLQSGYRHPAGLSHRAQEVAALSGLTVSQMSDFFKAVVRNGCRGGGEGGVVLVMNSVESVREDAMGEPGIRVLTLPTQRTRRKHSKAHTGTDAIMNHTDTALDDTESAEGTSASAPQAEEESDDSEVAQKEDADDAKEEDEELPVCDDEGDADAVQEDGMTESKLSLPTFEEGATIEVCTYASVEDFQRGLPVIASTTF